MKKTIAALLLALPLLAQAGETYSLNFKGIPLVQFAAATYRSMLKRDYVISSELLASDRPISVAVREVSAADLPKLISNVLAAQGVQSVERDGVFFLSLAGDSDGAAGVAGRGDGRFVPSVLSELRTPVSTLSTVVGNSGVPADVAGRMGRAQLVGVNEVFRPVNRKSDFVVAVLNAAFATKPATDAAGVVVITAPEAEMERIMTLARSVDEAGHRVKLSATFVEVSTNEGESLGVSVIASVLGAKLGVRLGDTSGGALTLSSNGFQAVIDALASDGRFKQVSAPVTIVDDYKKSKLLFGDRVPTIGSTTLDRNGNPINQVQYQQSGVVLDVTPSVLGSGKINVEIDGSVSSFSATNTGVNGSPTLSNRQVQTTVTVDDGELVMIGGLNNNKTAANRSGFSFLPKSWAAHSESAANTDLVLILSASVVK